MKTKELKSLLEKMGYSVRRIEKMIVIENEFGGAIATIQQVEDYEEVMELSKYINQKLGYYEGQRNLDGVEE